MTSTSARAETVAASTRWPAAAMLDVVDVFPGKVRGTTAAGLDTPTDLARSRTATSSSAATTTAEPSTSHCSASPTASRSQVSAGRVDLSQLQSGQPAVSTACPARRAVVDQARSTNAKARWAAGAGPGEGLRTVRYGMPEPFCGFTTNTWAEISCPDPVVAHLRHPFHYWCGPPHRPGGCGVRRVRWHTRSTARTADALWSPPSTPSRCPRWMPSRYSIGKSRTCALPSPGCVVLASTRCGRSVMRIRRHRDRRALRRSPSDNGEH